MEIGLYIEDIYTLINPKKVTITEDSKNRVKKCIEFMNELNKDSRPIYGISTGFGYFQNQWISREKQEQLQINLIRSQQELGKYYQHI